MSGFSFGAPSGQPTGTGAFSFGAPKTTAATPAFGTSTTALPSFGATAAAAPAFASTPTFGAAAAAVPAFGSTPAAAPAFGATPAAAPAFGATPAAAPAFGTITAAAPAFGATAAATTATPTFGAVSATLPAFGATPSAAPAFGASATATHAFGSPATGTTTPAFGAAPAAATTTTGFALPTASTPAFGVTATPTTAAPALSFGATTTAAPAFGAATTTAPPAFGATATSSTPATLSFGLGGTATNTTTAATTTAPTLTLGTGLGGVPPSFSFAKPNTATTTASLNFGTTTSTATGLAANMFGKPLTTQTNTTATAAPFVGLGGIDISATQPKVGDSKQDIKVKETQVPEEIAKTVEALKTHIKSQKTICSDIGRTSTSKLTNVSSGITNIKWALQEIANSVESNYKQIKLLRRETNKTIQSVEMAQRTQDTPAGLQFENIAPFQYFQNLVAKYEQDLINFRQQIEQTEHHMRSLANPQTVSPDDLKRGFQQINESFISLAGRLHEIHQKVENQKEQYLNLRKYRLRDSTNVFEKLEQPVKVDNTRITTGPTPFSNITAMSSFGKSFGNSTVQQSK